MLKYDVVSQGCPKKLRKHLENSH